MSSLEKYICHSGQRAGIQKIPGCRIKSGMTYKLSKNKTPPNDGAFTLTNLQFVIQNTGDTNRHSFHQPYIQFLEY